MDVVACSQCGTKNRIKSLRLEGQHVCGKCGATLSDPYLHGLVRSAAHKASLAALAIAILLSLLPGPEYGILVLLWVVWVLLAPLIQKSRLGSSPAANRRVPNASSEQPSEPFQPTVGADLDGFVKRLARQAWGYAEKNDESFELEAALLHKLASEAFVISRILDHVGRNAPGLNVPSMTPRIIRGSEPGIGGQFIQRDGTVEILVHTQFFFDRSATISVLCHELCHYVLEAGGIREPSTDANERLTDVAMFVFGVGDAYLAGFRRGNESNRPGHRLGYLSDDEYRYVASQVIELRASGRLQDSESKDLERRLAAVIPDKGSRERTIDYWKRRLKTQDRAKAIKGALEDRARG